ncbi:MAG: acetylglutamate kinase [Candidatus Kapabacteria bacterium]|nr:acetylglutamate kinase [Candidatus Kapabacteria bacterium]
MRVIKIGGAIIDSPHMRERVLSAIARLDEPCVLVHGGGVVATRLAQQLNIPQTMVDGRRVTDSATLEIVVMAYAGSVNKSLVAELHAMGRPSIGLTGADADVVRAHRRQHPTLDFGFVGDIDHVNAKQIRSFLDQGMSVVVAPITHDGGGQLLNTNADTMAAEIAIALAKTADSHADGVSLHFVFEHRGVLASVDESDTVFRRIESAAVPSLIDQGVITKGMMPKITNAVRAAEAGVVVVIQHADDCGTTHGTRVV